MKFAAVALFAAGAYAATVSVTETEAAATVTEAPAATVSETKEQKCVAACIKADPADIECQAACVGVPHPKSADLTAVQGCASACVTSYGGRPAQSTQSAVSADTIKYASCMSVCQVSHYYDPSATAGTDAKATGGAGSGSGSGSGSDNADSTATGTDAEAATGTESGAAASGTGNAGNTLTFSLSAIVGAVGIVALAL